MLPRGLNRFAKAILPAAITLIAVIQQLVATGEFDKTETATAITGIAGALITYRVPNAKSGIRRWAKALLPALGTIVAIAIQWGVTGEFDRSELSTAVTGLINAAVTYLVANEP